VLLAGLAWTGLCLSAPYPRCNACRSICCSSRGSASGNVARCSLRTAGSGGRSPDSNGHFTSRGRMSLGDRMMRMVDGTGPVNKSRAEQSERDNRPPPLALDPQQGHRDQQSHGPVRGMRINDRGPFCRSTPSHSRYCPGLPPGGPASGNIARCPLRTAASGRMSLGDSPRKARREPNI
jgi:hypothetical protein